MSHKPHELRLCGLTAVRARFQRDPGSILRLYFDRETGRKVGAISKALAAARKVYRCVEPPELEKIAGSVHHGGIVAVVLAAPLRAPSLADLARWARARTPLVLLDRIGNAHNLGAIARTAAFLGLEHLVIPNDPTAAVPNDAAYRVSEGGLEHVTVWRVPSLPALARSLAAAGYEVIGAATRAGDVRHLPAMARPWALAMGNEEAGLSSELAQVCTRRVTIAGSGRVESLNVSVAGAVLLHALVAARG